MVTAHPNHHHIPRHSDRTAWGDDELHPAAEQYATGMSLADVAAGYSVDTQTVGPCLVSLIGTLSSRERTDQLSVIGHVSLRIVPVPERAQWSTAVKLRALLDRPASRRSSGAT